MKKTWNALFDKHGGEYRRRDRRDALTEIHFLSRTGHKLQAREGVRRSEPMTGEPGLGG